MGNPLKNLVMHISIATRRLPRRAPSQTCGAKRATPGALLLPGKNLRKAWRGGFLILRR